MSSRRPARCSFCWKGSEEVDYLVAGPGGVAICDECADLAHEIASEALRPSSDDLLVTGISLLVTNDRRRGGILGLVEDAGLAVRRGKVTWVGPQRELPARYRELPELPCEGRVVCPGFVDPSVRVLSWDERRDEAQPAREVLVGAVEGMLTAGTTAVDLRVGGGQDPGRELALLEMAGSVAGDHAGSVRVTWVVSPGMSEGDRDVVVLPTAHRIASAFEVSTPASGRRLARVPLRLRETAAEESLLSRALSLEGVVDAPDRRIPVVLEVGPALVGAPLPAATLWEDGRVCALAGGSSPDIRVDDPGLVLAVGAGLGGLSAGQAVWSCTRGGALAFGDDERGVLRPGAPGDLVVLDAGSLEEVVRRPTGGLAWRVAAAGSLVGR